RDFVAFSTESTVLGRGSRVIHGDVGANARRSRGDEEDGDRPAEVVLAPDARVLDASARVVGDTVRLGRGSTVYDLYDNDLLDRGGDVLGRQHRPLGLPVLTLPPLPPITPGQQTVTVPA